jgi:hypothetical protein
MKKIIIGLVVFSSISAFAGTECTLNLGRYEFSKTIRAELSKKYQIVESNARFKVDIQGIFMSEECSAVVNIKESNNQLYEQGTGSERISFISLRGSVLPRLGEKAIKRAIKNLKGCL